MSEKKDKGGRPRTGRNVGANVRISPDVNEKLIKYAKSRKIPKKVIASILLDRGMEYDVFDPEWIDKLIADKEDLDRKYDYLDDACEALTFLDKKWKCLWGQKGAPPKIKVLTKYDDEVKDACKNCNITQQMTGKILDLEQQAKELRDMAKQGVIVSIPSCSYGGRINENGTKLYCKDPRKTAEWRDVKKFCRTLRNGANCESLKWTTVSMKGDLPGENK